MNEYEIRRFIDVIHPDGQLFEIRVIDGRKTMSGYFTDSLTAYQAIKGFTFGNIYMVFNQIKDACYSRQQRDSMVLSPKTTTSDQDITGYQWLLIDIDPIRPSDCNSSDAELKAAYGVSSMVGRFMRERGFSEPVFGMSGNGYHYLYRVAFGNTPENQQAVKDMLTVLAMMFNTDLVNIDTSVYSPAQLTKLMGTVSRKGTDKDDGRPQRLSKLIHVPKEIRHNDISLVVKIAKEMPQPEKPTYHNNYGRDTFDIDSFIRSNGIGVSRDFQSSGVRKIVLESCPFNHSHKAPDSALFVMRNGAIGFKCLHNSCEHYTWKDVRIQYDPTAYSGNDYTRSVRPTDRSHSLPAVVIPETKEIGSKFVQLHQVKSADRSKVISIPTKITGLDKRIIGLNKGETSIISGTSGCGKSTLVNQIALNAIQSGFKCSIWSGELTAIRMKNWIHLQAAGKPYTTQSSFGENSYYVKSEIGMKIDEWLKNSLWLYNNDYGNKFNQLVADMKEHIVKEGIDLIVLDNLMAMDILMLEGFDKNEKQTKMITELIDIAKKLNVHMILIAHPRKVTSFLRKNDIAGTADLANAVDNVFIIHRVNNDFVRTAGEFYGNTIAAGYFTFNNVLEVCKNRDCGIQDELFGLFFEKESKRFLNDRYESVMYGWNEMYETREIDYSEIYRDPSLPSREQLINSFEADVEPKEECPF